MARSKEENHPGIEALEKVRAQLKDVPDSFVRYLRAGRPQMKITTKSGVSQAHLSDLETGRRELTWEAAERLAPVLGTQPEHLMSADVLAGLKSMAYENPGDLDAQVLVEAVKFLDQVLASNDNNEQLLMALIELAESRLGTYRQQRSAAVATKSAGKEQRSSRDGLGRRISKPHGLRQAQRETGVSLKSEKTRETRDGLGRRLDPPFAPKDGRL